MTIATQHDWLRRLSDYHSGGVDTAEAVAVEEHLASCEECRQALRVYRRFYALASSPLRLGEPSSVVAEEFAMSTDSSDRFTDDDGLEDRPRGRMRPERGRLLLGIASVLAASLVIAGFLAVLGPRIGGVGRHPTPTTPTPTSPPTPAPTIPVGQGWTPAGPAWAQWIVFASSEPRTAYLCGTPTNNDASRQAPVTLGLSLDSGRTWQTVATGILATSCLVDVDPTNAHDLVLEVWPCVISASVSCPTQLYRSLDGGGSWHLAALPPLPGSSSSASYVAFQWAWQGSTLFVSPFFATTQPQGLLAVSVAEGPFAWVNQRALLTGVPAGMQLNDLYATTTAVYVDFYASNCSPQTNCILTKVSADRGATWSVFAPQYQGGTMNLFDQSVSIADGHTLIGWVMSAQNPHTGIIYVTSTDGGATWTPMPLPPGNLDIMALASTPSGIYYAEMRNYVGEATAPLGVYRLVPGASTWVLVGPRPNSGAQIAVSWDDQGNPLALWSYADIPSSAQVITAGLITHTP